MPEAAHIFTHKVSTDTIKKFSYFFDAMTYARITSARRELIQFLEDIHVSKRYVGMFALSMSEILTNLVKHPDVKPQNVYLSLELKEGALYMDIADDGSVFADFDAKCKIAIHTQVKEECMQEGGYGLGCILRQHADVRYIPNTLSKDSLNHFVISETFQGTYGKNIELENKKKTIFVVDDDPIILKIQTQMLEGEYNVVSFQDAREALQVFSHQKPALIISDLNMPEMDGIAFRQSLYHLPNGQEIPFVFLSGHDNEKSNYRINQLGIDDFLTKPITKETLLSVVARLILRAEQVRAVLQKKLDRSVTHILKPELPAVFESWRIKTFNYSPETGGGDFIISDHTSERLFAVLADVVGHDMQSKFFACAYAGYLRSIFKMHRKDISVEKVMDVISSAIEGDSFLEMASMTCQAFKLKPGGVFRVASAGHPPPIRISRDSCSIIESFGPMPGMIGEIVYKGLTLNLSPGEKILLATDGFFSVFDQTQIDLHPLLNFLRENADLNIDEIYDSLSNKLERLLKDSKEKITADDITFIIVEYKGE